MIGIDGSGKTTLAHALADQLTAAGRPAAYLQAPSGRPTLNRLAVRLGRRDAIDLFGRFVYLAIESTIRFAVISYALIKSALTGRIAVLDRYVYCQFAVVRARRQSGERFIRALFGLFPKPDLVFFLAVSPEIAQRRVALRGTDSEELEYLMASDQAYRSLPEWPDFVVIDADAGPDEVLAEVVNLVQDAYRPLA